MPQDLIAYNTHPLADIFPLMTGEEFDALKSDILANGLLEPIWLFDGQILDGRNRFKACQEVGVSPVFREYEGDSPVSFIISLNLKRRHLNESQRAMVAARLANMTHGGIREGQNTKASQTANLHLEPITRSEAADMLAVSPRSVAAAKKVQEQAEEPLRASVERGEIAVSTAAVLTETPPETQRYAAENPKEAPAIVHNHRAQGTGENEWYTPKAHIDLARSVMGGFDLDPASSPIANETVQAAEFYTAEDNGLLKPWKGKVWMNPPYAQPAIAQFSEKLASEWENGNVSEAIALTHNYTDTAWFHRLAATCKAICFTRGRIGFLSPEGKKAAPTQGQAFFYFGDDSSRFIDAFSEIGFVVEVARAE